MFFFQLLPKELIQGYNYRRVGHVMYWNRRLTEPTWGKQAPRDEGKPCTNLLLYTWFKELCAKNNLVADSLITVKVEVRELCVALEIENM